MNKGLRMNQFGRWHHNNYSQRVGLKERTTDVTSGRCIHIKTAFIKSALDTIFMTSITGSTYM